MLIQRILGRQVKPKTPENWNRNDYQGKRKDQVEYSNTVASIAVVLLVLFLFMLGLNYLVTLWK